MYARGGVLQQMATDVSAIATDHEVAASQNEASDDTDNFVESPPQITVDDRPGCSEKDRGRGKTSFG
jgi:hypothetical protein